MEIFLKNSVVLGVVEAASESESGEYEEDTEDDVVVDDVVEAASESESGEYEEEEEESDIDGLEENEEEEDVDAEDETEERSSSLMLAEFDWVFEVYGMVLSVIVCGIGSVLSNLAAGLSILSTTAELPP